MPADSKLELSGEHTDAVVMTTMLDENCREQIQSMIDHEAFENPVRIMPDTHFGRGAVIGFTMPFSDRIVPNTVGVDIGCGMYATNLGASPFTRFDDAEAVDTAIRDAVPMGRAVHSGGAYHMKNDFPWDELNAVWAKFLAEQDVADADVPVDAAPFGIDYFKELCGRVGYDMTRAINSVGSLGGGNHFIEFAQAGMTGEVWCVIHSGSRGIGLKVAQYWQDCATNHVNSQKNIEDVPENYRPYLTDEWKPDAEKIRADFEGKEIGQMFDKMSQLIQEYGPHNADRNTDLDYLEGVPALQYLRDMLFAQRYASENRKVMMRLVEQTLGVEREREIESVHNYVDFTDQIIRKGATPARQGEMGIIPFNMAHGSVVIRGQGNPEWNYSAPHGAGRRMSRRGAYRDLSVDDFEAEMAGVENFNDPDEILDEAPMAYKPTDVIMDVIEETATVVDWLTPVHAIKAEE